MLLFPGCGVEFTHSYRETTYYRGVESKERRQTPTKRPEKIPIAGDPSLIRFWQVAIIYIKEISYDNQTHQTVGRSVHFSVCQ
jgi:hypothetical protein